MPQPCISSSSRVLALVMVIFQISACSSLSQPSMPQSVKVAAIHYAPIVADVETNRRRLVELTQEAAHRGAKIVVHTEMATSGYGFFSRAEAKKVAEPVPGPTTDALSEVARRENIYVVVGLPVIDPNTDRIFNSAVLIDPAGQLVGQYRKRSHLLESAYNAAVNEPIPVFNTQYGRVAILICADLMYSHFSRVAAVSGADILLVPANVGVSEDFLRVRALENNVSIVVANRYGKEGRGSAKSVFDQDTFTITSPWDYDFSYDARSLIVSSAGHVLAAHEGQKEGIAYADLPIGREHPFPVVRRPDLYSLLAQDTLEPYTFTRFGLPPPATVGVAALDPSPNKGISGAEAAIVAAMQNAKSQGIRLRLAVFPEGYFDGRDPTTLDGLRSLSARNGIDIVAGAHDLPDGKLYTLMATPEGGLFKHNPVHLWLGEPAHDGPSNFLVVDRDYGRVSLLSGPDLLAPETAEVLTKMGVDLVAVPAAVDIGPTEALWRSRAGSNLHIIVANLKGREGVFIGGYRTPISEVMAEGMAITTVDTAHVREKKVPRAVDVTPLVSACTISKC